MSYLLLHLINSKKAINMSIQIVRVFERLRKYALKQSSNALRIEEIHKLLMLHIDSNDNKFSEQDEAISHIIEVLNNLIGKPKEIKKIGFV